jgi:addiction module HigA family antidote
MTKLLEEMYLEDFMKSMRIIAHQLASNIDVSLIRINEIVHGTRLISANTALRLSTFFSMDSQFWVNLRSELGMRIMKPDLQVGIAPRTCVYQMAVRYG